VEHKNISCLIPTGFGHIAYITDTELQKNNKKINYNKSVQALTSHDEGQ
jgi:hypothetical protein